ncbi:MAG TPA: DUF3566 domain-containing protein [Acidimicrobiales bacterium]|nr:DUF3566 domain-containing protein [Acidimicrobiales bacterium]
MAQGRRVRRVIRKIDPWTVLRFSALFYASMLVVVLVAGTLLWVAASSVGVIDNVEKFIKELFALESFRISGVKLFTSSAVGGLVLVLLGTGMNVLMAVVYNLTADIVGGVEVTMLEEDTAGASRRSVV